MVAYSTYGDVLDACGLTLKRITTLHEGDMTDTQVETMIESFIDEADKQIKDLLGIPITITEEIHVIDEDVSLTKVYLGSYDDSGDFLEDWHGLQPVNVQGCVQDILCVCVNGVRVKTTDDTYGWTWNHSGEDSITFDSDLGDGAVVKITYTYDPYVVTVPVNVKKASACMAGQALIEHLIGLRQAVTAFEAEGDSAERIPDKEALYITRNTLKGMAKDALDSIGYGFDFTAIKG